MGVDERYLQHQQWAVHRGDVYIIIYNTSSKNALEGSDHAGPLPESFLIVYLWEYIHGNRWGPDPSIISPSKRVCFVYRSTPPTTHKFSFSLFSSDWVFQVLLLLCTIFSEVDMCKRKGVFFFRFSVVGCCEKYGERTPSTQGAMGNRERNNPVINCEANITRSPTHGIKGVCWHRYHSSAHSHTAHSRERTTTCSV